MNKDDKVYLNICSLNIQGLAKYEEDSELKRFLSKFDLIGLCETWAEINEDFAAFMSGYVTLNSIRPKRKGAVRGLGGICVSVRENLISENVVKRIYNHFIEFVVSLLDGSKFENLTDLAIFFTYIAPQNSSFYSAPNENGIEMLTNKIAKMTSEYSNAEVLIAGDLNARTKDFLDFIPDDNIDHVCGENNVPWGFLLYT